ncbi:hypothetical protein [Streptomyces sp. NPDC007100]
MANSERLMRDTDAVRDDVLAAMTEHIGILVPGIFLLDKMGGYLSGL